MSFFLYLLYIVLTFLRPTELFWPDLEAFRPMLWLWLLAFGAAFISVLGQHNLAGRRAYFGLLAMFVVAIFLSQAIHSSMSGALDAMSTFSASAMLFVLTCMNLTSTERVRTACNTIVVCLVIIAIMGIVAYHYGWMAQKLVLQQGADTGTDVFEIDPEIIPADDQSGQFLWRVRSVGFLNDPNDLAQVLVMVLPMLWRLYEKRHAVRNLILVGMPSAVIAYAIYLTRSRGAVVGLGAIFIFATRRRLGTARMAALGIVLLFVASVANVGGGGDRDFSTKEESAAERIEAWYSGIQMLKAKPVFGVGFGNFIEEHPLTAHNSVVLCFSELGLFGYFFWGGLIVLAFRELDQSARLSPKGSSAAELSATLSSSLAGFMVCAWFLSRTYQPTLYLLLAFCACAAWCARRDQENAPDAPSWAPRVSWAMPTAIANIAGIAAVYGFVTLSRLSGG
jgi:hypothetical protein